MDKQKYFHESSNNTITKYKKNTEIKYGTTDKLHYDIHTHDLTHFISTTRDIYTQSC